MTDTIYVSLLEQELTVATSLVVTSRPATTITITNTTNTNTSSSSNRNCDFDLHHNGNCKRK